MIQNMQDRLKEVDEKSRLSVRQVGIPGTRMLESIKLTNNHFQFVAFEEENASVCDGNGWVSVYGVVTGFAVDDTGGVFIYTNLRNFSTFKTDGVLQYTNEKGKFRIRCYLRGSGPPSAVFTGHFKIIV